MTTEKLIKAIKDYECHALPISKNIFTGNNITAELIEKHCNRYGITCQEEQPLLIVNCLLYTSPSPRDYAASRMPSSA